MSQKDFTVVSEVENGKAFPTCAAAEKYLQKYGYSRRDFHIMRVTGSLLEYNVVA